jgi:hypothetical protein
VEGVCHDLLEILSQNVSRECEENFTIIGVLGENKTWE